MQQEKIPVENFVKTAVRILGNGEEAVHAVESGLNGALHLY